MFIIVNVSNIDELSKDRASKLFGSSEIKGFEVGTTRGL
jgi:hypothetical protein